MRLSCFHESARAALDTLRAHLVFGTYAARRAARLTVIAAITRD